MIDITEELQDVVPPHVIEQILKAKPYSMTSGRRLAHTYQTIQELDVAGIEGDIVECGVWKGGQIISAWLANTQSKRKFWLFDTFEGMTEPTMEDYKVNLDGTKGYAYKSTKAKQGYENWCRSELSEVVQNLHKFHIPMKQVKMVKGDCNKTLQDQSNIPDKIALLRLDTDWYESTLTEILKLWPRLVVGGIMVLDDFNSWQGSKKAFTEVFGDSLKIHNIDRTAIWVRKETV
jgi:hypothetical protein